MKKLIIIMVGLAVALSYASIASAKKRTPGEKTKITETTKRDGSFVIKEESKLNTGTGKTKIKTTTIENGKFTTEKGTIVSTKHKGDVKVEKMKFKLWNENNPNSDTDNTVIMYDGKKEVQMHVGKNIKVNHLRAVKGKGTIYSTYNPLKHGWEMAYIE